MDKNNYIINIERKLTNNEPLTAIELRSVITALRESTQCFQEPYYEVIYHDEVDNTEHRIMEPVNQCKHCLSEEYDILEDVFQLHFKRIVKKGKTNG